MKQKKTYYIISLLALLGLLLGLGIMLDATPVEAASQQNIQVIVHPIPENHNNCYMDWRLNIYSGGSWLVYYSSDGWNYYFAQEARRENGYYYYYGYDGCGNKREFYYNPTSKDAGEVSG